MAFDLFPALDVKDGRLASLVRGDPGTLETFEGDPFEAAGRLVAAGAAWLHLVDLNAALEGRPANLDLLERVSGLPVRVQAGGGLSIEGAGAALVHAFTALDKQRVISLIHPENHASRRVAERLGETPQGRAELKGTELLVYGIDRHDAPLWHRMAGCLKPCSAPSPPPVT